jgi:hypothetical protein
MMALFRSVMIGLAFVIGEFLDSVRLIASRDIGHLYREARLEEFVFSSIFISRALGYVTRTDWLLESSFIKATARARGCTGGFAVTSQ